MYRMTTTATETQRETLNLNTFSNVFAMWTWNSKYYDPAYETRRRPNEKKTLFITNPFLRCAFFESVWASVWFTWRLRGCISRTTYFRAHFTPWPIYSRHIDAFYYFARLVTNVIYNDALIQLSACNGMVCLTHTRSWKSKIHPTAIRSAYWFKDAD